MSKNRKFVARIAKAMGHPTRIAILHILASQESCFFGDIHDELPIAKATVSQHLKELKEAGLNQGENRNPQNEVMHQQRELGNSQ
jgi:DNA-binding transcriptional ArsR family regulator